MVNGRLLMPVKEADFIAAAATTTLRAKLFNYQAAS